MYGNIKKEVLPTFKSSVLGAESASEGNKTKDGEAEALEELTNEKEAKKRRIV